MHIYKVITKADGKEYIFTSIAAIVHTLDSSLTGIGNVQSLYNRRLRQNGSFENKRCKVERMPVNASAQRQED